MKRAVFAKALLEWYDRAGRDLPWRTKGGGRPDPYHIWLSEIMLQQTTVVTVQPYYARFLARWPHISALAAAPLDEVLVAWAGLGYYARARNLHACAQVVAAQFGGQFPQSEAALLALPGIGPYTAAAIAAFAFDQPTAPVDGNWERVVARLFAVTTPLPQAKPALRELSQGLVPRQRPGDFAQAMMDLGATVCSPSSPKCGLCPVQRFCQASAQGLAESLPARAPKKLRPLRHGVCFWIERPDGALLLRSRPPKGLLGGMTEVPSTPWRDTLWSEAEALSHAPAGLRWRPLPGLVRHGFTHFELELTILAARSRTLPPDLGPTARWVLPEALGQEALPSLMRKVVAAALKQPPRPHASGGGD